MRYETIHNLILPKIGFGTWTIGGRTSPAPAEDGRDLAAMRSALELGYTHFDTAEYYAAGYTEELLGQAIQEGRFSRENLLITSKVSPEHLDYDHVLLSCENSLRRLKVEYLDLYLIHWPNKAIGLEETFRALNKLVKDGKVRYLGVSNFKLRLLKKAVELSETPLLTNQVPYSIPDRSYVINGVLDFCQKNQIILTAYSPVKFRNLARNKTVNEVAHSRMVTPQQIALSWLTSQPGVITIPMSFNPQHQAENLHASDLVLSQSEMDRLDSIREKS